MLAWDSENKEDLIISESVRKYTGNEEDIARYLMEFERDGFKRDRDRAEDKEVAW